MRPGRAEVRARVTLSAMTDAGDIVTIPDDELKALLTLVNYDDGSALSDWNIEFDSPAVSNSQKAQSIDFWITTGNDCGASVKAAASILPPGSTTPITTRKKEGSSFDSNVDLSGLVKNPLWQITMFKLERVSSSDRVFVNGLQQIKLKVELAFTDLTTNRPGVPTDEELASLTIAFGDEGVPLPVDTAGAQWWVTSPGVAGAGDTTYDKGYLPYPGVAIPAEADADHQVVSPQASIFRYFYVACRGVPAQSVQLCAYVRCRDGWVFRSNGTDTDPCGGEHPGKDSQEYVLGVSVEVGTIDRYPWVRTVLSGDDDGIDAYSKVINPDSVHAYSLSFNDKMNEDVGIRSLVVEPAGMIQWHDKGTGDYRACFTGYAVPGSTAIVWNSEVPVGSTPRPTLPTADIKKAVIVLVGRQDISYQSGKENGPLVLHTTDWYGNTNTLHVRFDSAFGDGRWKLVLYR
jgi:hypothetical protein